MNNFPGNKLLQLFQEVENYNRSITTEKIKRKPKKAKKKRNDLMTLQMNSFVTFRNTEFLCFYVVL